MNKAVVLAVVAAMTATGALAGDAAEAISTRQQGMKAIGAAFKGLRDGAMSGAPAAELKPYADRLAALAKESAGWFPAGSGPEAGVKTEAKAAIWTRPADFAAARQLLEARAGALKGAVDSGDEGAIRAALGGVGQACKGCHDPFREKD